MRLMAFACVVLVLAGCGATTTTTTATTNGATAPPTTQPTIGATPTALPTAATAPPGRSRAPGVEPLRSGSSNEASYTFATRLLLEAGARSLGELEPAHGASGSIIGGEFRGFEIAVGVAPGETSDLLLTGEACGTPFSFDDEGRARFPLGGFGWSVTASVQLGSDPLPEVSAELATAVLCAQRS